MKYTSFFSDLYSHPDKFLENHLTEVARIAVKNLGQLPIGNVAFLSKKKLLRLTQLCALCHDLGKSTGYFQRYLFSSKSDKDRLKASKETHHSLLSSIISFCVVMEELEEDKELSEE